jgi:hypothetical protein
MRTIVFAIFVFLTQSLYSKAFSQDYTLPKTEQEAKLLICQKWRMTTMEVNGRKREVGEDGGIVVVYKKDGTFTEESKMFSKGGGKWAYKHTTYTLETNEAGGKTSVQLLSLNKDYMSLKVKYPDMEMIITYKSE